MVGSRVRFGPVEHFAGWVLCVLHGEGWGTVYGDGSVRRFGVKDGLYSWSGGKAMLRLSQYHVRCVPGT